MHRKLCLIAHDIRSAHNVGSLLRTADGLGLDAVYLTGYSPHPVYSGDPRLAHIAAKSMRQIHKTALGAEVSVKWEYAQDPITVINALREAGYIICALEQANGAIIINNYEVRQPTVLIVGNEVTGLPESLQSHCDYILEIPMLGQKESYNVVQAAAMALYQMRFH